MQAVGDVGMPEAVSDGIIVCVAVSVSLGRAVICEAVAVGVGKLNGKVGGMSVGVAAGGRVSARERKIPPMTRITETIAMITPTPNWRRACMLNSPWSC